MGKDDNEKTKKMFMGEVYGRHDATAGKTRNRLKFPCRAAMRGVRLGVLTAGILCAVLPFALW